MGCRLFGVLSLTEQAVNADRIVKWLLQTNLSEQAKWKLEN